MYIYILLIFLIILYSCSGPSKKDNLRTDINQDEIIYYEPSPYLMINTNDENNIETKIIYLPDPNKQKTIKVDEYKKQHNLKLDLENGLLTAVPIDTVSTPIPKELIEAAKASMLVNLENTPKEGKKIKPPPKVYKIVIDGDKIILIDLENSVELNEK